MIRIGFIGTGNMGGALATAISKNKDVQLVLSNRTQSKAQALADTLNATVGTNAEAAGCDYVFIGVKPQQFDDVLEQIKESFSKTSVIVSMVAGWPISKIQSLSNGLPVIRIMPNTPVSIGEGITLLSCSSNVKAESAELLLHLLKTSGQVLPVDEKLINAASAVSGCGPAFVDIFINSLADGAVSVGVPRKQALDIAAQMVIGTAKLVLQTQKHPELLKDEVCSPAGSTIEGVIALENGNFRSSVINAVRASAEKNSKLWQKED